MHSDVYICVSVEEQIIVKMALLFEMNLSGLK